MKSRRYCVRVGAEVRGPYGVAQLRELAEVGVVSRATDAAPEEGGAWIQLGTIPESGAIFPERSALGFKPTTFDVANTESAAPVDLREIIAATRVEGPVLRLRPQLAPPSHPHPSAPPPGAPSGEPGEVEAMVQEVARREAQFAPPPPPPPKPKPNQRLRLVVILSVLGNATLAGILTYYHAWSHDLSVLITVGLAVIYHGGLAIAYFALPKQ